MEEKNLGGRPPIYDGDNESDVLKVIELCNSFFEHIKGDDERSPEPPTVTGLTLHLGFENKSTLYDYSKKDKFSNPIKRALTKIEQYHEIAVAMGDKCTGNIFVLKNFNWKDTQDVTHNGNISNLPPKIVFTDEDED